MRAYFTRAGIDLAPMVAELLKGFRRPPRPEGPPHESWLNTDLFPRDELAAELHR
jgi:hypothetical protein